MGASNLKKLFIYSSEYMKQLCENILADLASADRTTVSLQIEKCIEQATLPQNDIAASWVKEMYTDNLSVNETLFKIYDVMGGGLDWKPRYNNAWKLVQFSHDLSVFATNNDTDDGVDIHDTTQFHFLSQFDSVISVISEFVANPEADSKTATTADEARTLYDMASQDITSIRFSDVWKIILDNWSILYNSQRAYRLMADMSAMQHTLRNTPDTRVKLVSILKDVSDEWD